jgi:hypothetical protein
VRPAVTIGEGFCRGNGECGMYFAPIASQSNSGSRSCQTFNVSTTIEALSTARLDERPGVIESDDSPLGDD